MTNEEILRGNRLIVDFMGVRPRYNSWTNNFQWDDGVFFAISNINFKEAMDSIVKYVKYRTDWNWLMQVVIKIEHELDWGLVMYPDMCYWNQYGDKPVGLDDDFCGNRIESVYNAVVAFIEWYNRGSK